MTAPNTQIVGQSLALECSVTTVRGITSRVDVVWSIDGALLERNEGLNLTIRTPSSTSLSNTYSIPHLSTDDEDRMYQCEMVINTDPLVVATSNLTLNVTGKFIDANKSFKYICSFVVPPPTVTVFPSGPIQGAMVGSPQDIQ